MRRRQKFNFIWTILILLVLVGWFRSSLTSAGYSSSEAFFADAIVFSIRAGIVLVPLAILYGIQARKRRRLQSERAERNVDRRTRVR